MGHAHLQPTRLGRACHLSNFIAKTICRAVGWQKVLADSIFRLVANFPTINKTQRVQQLPAFNAPSAMAELKLKLNSEFGDMTELRGCHLFMNCSLVKLLAHKHTHTETRT